MEILLYVLFLYVLPYIGIEMILRKELDESYTKSIILELIFQNKMYIEAFAMLLATPALFIMAFNDHFIKRKKDK